MNILRDNRPFYVTFEDPSIQVVSELVNIESREYTKNTRFKHQVLPLALGKALIAAVPLGKELSLDPNRVSLFITPPRTYYRAHKDGFNLQVGLNYPIVIRDDRSVTRWYHEELSEKYEIAPDGKQSREVIGFNPMANTPACSFTMTPTEAVLLNVDRFHDFHNKSEFHRVILTYRSIDPAMTFDRASRRLLELQ